MIFSMNHEETLFRHGWSNFLDPFEWSLRLWGTFSTNPTHRCSKQILYIEMDVEHGISPRQKNNRFPQHHGDLFEAMMMFETCVCLKLTCTTFSKLVQQQSRNSE